MSLEWIRKRINIILKWFKKNYTYIKLKCKNVKNKYKNLGLEIKILSFGTLLIIVFILITKINILKNPNFLLDRYNSPRDVAATNATITATIFAITITLTILGFQYFSQNISPKILYPIFKSKFFIGMILLYAISILFNIFMLSFLMNESLVYFSYILLAFCILYFLSYFYFMINSLQPDKILLRINRIISNENYKDDNYTILEQAAVKAIRNNDFFTFFNSLSILFKKEKYLLNRLLTYEINEKYDYEARHSGAENIVYSFLRKHNQLYFEIMKERNESFLIHYLQNLKEIHVLLLKLMAIRPYREIRDHFNDIGFKIIELKLHGVYDYYLRFLREITIEEFNSMPSGDSLTIFQDKIEKFSDLNKNEQNKRTLENIIFEYFAYDRLGFLENLSKKASDNRLSQITFSINFHLSDLLSLSIKNISNKKMRNFLVMNILERLREIHINSINKEAYIDFIILPLDYLLKIMKDEETINSIGFLITRYYCNAVIESTKKDYYPIIHSPGEYGRILITEYGFEQIVDVIVDCLITILKITIENKKLKHVRKDHIARELFSIRDWKNHKNKKVKKKINKIIRQYNLRFKKLF